MKQKLTSGMKVKIRSDLQLGRYYGSMPAGITMMPFAGKEVTILKQVGSYYRIEEEPSYYDIEMFENNNPMKATELRIGNIVKPINPRHHEKYIEVESITHGKVNIDFREYSLDEIEPIPLTKEVLRQTNLTNNKVGNEWRYYDEETEELFVIEKMQDGFFYYTGGEGVTLSRKIESMHHLQNLYYDIMGQELIIQS